MVSDSQILQRQGRNRIIRGVRIRHVERGKHRLWQRLEPWLACHSLQAVSCQRKAQIRVLRPCSGGLDQSHLRQAGQRLCGGEVAAELDVADRTWRGARQACSVRDELLKHNVAAVLGAGGVRPWIVDGKVRQKARHRVPQADQPLLGKVQHLHCREEFCDRADSVQRVGVGRSQSRVRAIPQTVALLPDHLLVNNNAGVHAGGEFGFDCLRDGGGHGIDRALQACGERIGRQLHGRGREHA